MPEFDAGGSAAMDEEMFWKDVHRIEWRAGSKPEIGGAIGAEPTSEIEKSMAIKHIHHAVVNNAVTKRP